MKNSTLFFLSLFIILFSCKNDDDTIGTGGETPVLNYIPLSIGSYWVYGWEKIDTLGNISPLTQRDSVYVSGDTIINGNTYFVVEGDFFGSPVNKEYQRDSSGYLVNEKGNILFNPNNTTDLLWVDTIFVGSDPLVIIEYKMEGTETEIDVPAGVFNCFNYQGTVISQEDDYPWGVRNTGYYYADGIGKVQSRLFFYNSPDDIRSRLVDYHIE